MAEYLAPVDIANRAIQHTGGRRITAAQFANPTGTGDNEVAFSYDKVRVRELRRNCWRFATRRVYLYPIDVNTALFTPGQWSATQVYYPGAVVADANGALWSSDVNNNLGNQPALGSMIWEQYFGPLTVDPWQNPLVAPFTQPQVITSQGYNNGDLAYIMLGTPYAAGTVAIFRSLQLGNTDNPQTPDTWSATDVPPVGVNVQNPAPQVYYQNQVVLWNGVLYQSLLNGNAGNQPDISPAWWTPIVNVINEWVQGQTYTAGSFALDQVFSSVSYTLTGLYSASFTITDTIFQALNTVVNDQVSPANDPTNWQSMYTTWAIGTTYNLGQVVSYSGVLYQSLVAANVGYTPSTSPTDWTTTLTNTLYGSLNWLQLPGLTTLTPLVIDYPLNSGPASSLSTPNIFRLPNGYLRMAPKNPKGNVVSFLGAPSGDNTPDDWVFEGNYIVSQSWYPIRIRFVADVSDVTRMDSMFCEGLAAAIGLAIAPRTTQSENKVAGSIEHAYSEIMGEARDVNGIEVGYTEPPEDDYVNCRL